MKKFVASLLTGSMILSSAMPALAAGDEYAQSNDLPVQESQVQDDSVEESVEQSTETTGQIQDTESAPISSEEGSGETEPDVALEESENETSQVGETDIQETLEETEAVPEESFDETETVEETTEEEAGESDLDLPQTGKLSVVIYPAIERKKETTFTLSLDGEKEQVFTLPATGGEVPSEIPVVFDGLDGKEHTLEIRGDGFETYRQVIPEGRYDYSAQIYTGFNGQFTYEPGETHPGVLLIGDTTGDGIIDISDGEKIIDAIDRQTGEWSCDLNGDGIINMVDLQYFSGSYRITDPELEGLETLATLTKSILPALSHPEIDASTQIVSGSLEEMFQDNGGITLRPSEDTPISEEHPVTVNFDFGSDEMPVVMGGMTIKSPVDSENRIESGYVEVYCEGSDEPIQIPISPQARAAGGPSVKVESDGTLVVDFAGQVAVKKVTIRITGTPSNNLAEISKVEFLNDMENRIPEPEMSIPEGLSVSVGDKEFSVSWNACTNITGYEVEVSCNGVSENRKVTGTSLTVDQFQQEDLINGQKYQVRVRSLNGEWKSPYSDVVEAIPEVSERPAPPDGLKVSGSYRSIQATWKKMKDTDTYNFYYRKVGSEEYIKQEGLTTNQHFVSGLEDNTTYEVYVTGVNKLGESDPSILSKATTVNVQPAQMPNYRLINKPTQDGSVTQHIKHAEQYRGVMKESPLDVEKGSALGLVDNNYGSYYYLEDWDDGAAYPSPWKGVVVELDESYDMNYITFASMDDSGWYSNAVISYWDENGKEQKIYNSSLVERRGENGRRYYAVKLPEKIHTNKIRLCVTRGNGVRNINIAEIRFYEYDPIEAEIMGLYEDSMHTVLRSDVTEETILDLEQRLNTPEESSGECNPEKESLQKELDNARAILQSNLGEVLVIDSGITAKKDGHLGFSGLNAWQPLGITAYAGESVTLFVGHNSLPMGAKTNLQLVATQFNAESSEFVQTVTDLYIGKNEVTIPQIGSLDVEHGGSLYIQYLGNKENDDYSVRVQGGTEIPVLNLYDVSDEQEKRRLTQEYVEELETYVASLGEQHIEKHQNGAVDHLQREYDEQTCILGATEIMLNKMMFSVSAKQVLAGLGEGSVEQKAERLYLSCQAMEEMMTLFYQHKGLSDAADTPVNNNENNRLPSQHLNIRYQRMFAGAFMYASGNHIGVAWDSIPGLVQGVPIESDNGKYISGSYFGWGIGHEIGHNINQGVYAIAEVTNNYFAQLSQARDTNESVRFNYPDVYEKVTSNTTGRSSNVFTQLAMYWQLHLAYDRGYNFKTYDTYGEINDNLFFARVDRYARSPKVAPAPGGVALTLTSDVDQNLMRLSCAAANKNLMEFFQRWGMVPNEETKAYAAQFEAENRAIYYVNDDARVYEMEHGKVEGISGADIVGDDITAVVENPQVPNQVTIHLSNKAENSNDVLGYEIVRSMISGGQEIKEVVGFTTEQTFVDTVTSINNRVLSYDITVIDKSLNRSAQKKINSVKISHDGSYAKEDWEIVTNMTSDSDVTSGGTVDDPCAPQTKSGITQAFDNNLNTTYIGSAEGNPQIDINFGKSLGVTGVKYSAKDGNRIGQYEIQISQDGSEWKTVKRGEFDPSMETQIVYFQNENLDPWVCTYDASHLRLIAVDQAGKEIAISELDILGPTGDNVEFMADGETPSVGILKEDFAYDEEGGKIPAGSLVFTGMYKGNPAYNVLILYDGEGNIVGGVDETGALKSQQIILADVPDEGELGTTADGTWVYWIEPNADGTGFDVPKQVRAELYRVDDAMTNEGQRLVSDTNLMDVPSELPDIILKK